MLVLSDELDGGTGQLLPLGVRKIIGGYCGPVIQTNLDHAQPEFSLYFPTLADEGARSENLAAFHRLAIGDKIDVYGNKRAEVIEKKRQRKGNEEVLLRFEGYSKDSDEWIQVGSPDLAPLGTQRVTFWLKSEQEKHTVYPHGKYLAMDKHRQQTEGLICAGRHNIGLFRFLFPRAEFASEAPAAAGSDIDVTVLLSVPLTASQNAKRTDTFVAVMDWFLVDVPKAFPALNVDDRIDLSAALLAVCVHPSSLQLSFEYAHSDRTNTVMVMHNIMSPTARGLKIDKQVPMLAISTFE